MESRSKRNIQQFNGERYSTWKFRVRSLLGELQVLSVIDEPPPSHPDEEWKKKNMLAKGTIVEYLGDAFLNFAKGSATAKSVMDDLDKIYERRSLATQLALRKQLLSLKLQPDVTLFQHFNNFDNIITELISAGAKLDEMDKVSHLLLTLPTSYDGVITALETLGEEQLNLAFVKTRLLDHEVKLKADTTTELKVLHASTKKFASRSGFDKKKFHDNKKKPRPGNSMHKISKLYCDHCGRRNHVKKDCHFYKKIQQDSGRSHQAPTANTTQISGNDEDSFAFMFTTSYTNSISQIRSKGDYRVVHLPQETVREYSNEQYSGDSNNLDSVHNFIPRGTTLSNRNSDSSSNSIKDSHQVKSKNKKERIVSNIETYNERFQDDETEKYEISNESGKQLTNYNTDEISSGQSFDSSSNSIKNSQERHVEYNTQRYMTLYTEEISYKAKTTKKTDIIPITANVITRRLKVKKRSTTTPTLRERDIASDRTEKIEMLRDNHDSDDTKLGNSNSSHDTESRLTLESKHKPRAKQNYDKPRNHGKADKSRSNKKHKNAQIISQYDAVIDVQLANTELFKSLGMFDTVELDTNSRYDTTLYPRSAIKTEPVSTTNTIQPRVMRAQAEIRPQKPTAPTKPSRYLKSYESFYRKQFEESKRSKMPNEGHSVKPYKKDKKQKQNSIARRSNNDTIGVKDFNNYVIKRIKAIEKEINALKQMDDFSLRSRNDNNTDEVKVSNVTDKYEVKDKVGSKRNDLKGNVIKLLNENHDLNNKENNNRHTTRSHTMNTESTTNNTIPSKSIVIKKDAVNATVIDNKSTSQVTNNNVNVTNNTKKLNKEVITNNATSTATSVTNTIEHENVVTIHTDGITTSSTMAYSEQTYFYNPFPSAGKGKNQQLDPFSLERDGFYFKNYN